ncbi:MAG TPA: TolC family protein [Tepidisphaeraceae bacterium]|nr:TolC family protein [Tepidisphaeraceae bacterium]
MNKLGRGLEVALVCFALAGCADQKRDIALYQRQLDALPGATRPLPPDYTPLTLLDALRLAEKNDESLGLSGETYLQALIARDKAFSAFLPTIALDLNYSQVQKLRGSDGTPAHSFNIPINGDNALFSLNPYQSEAIIEQDTGAARQQRELLLNEQQIVLLDVVQAYYAVLTNERQVKVFQNSLAEQDERVRQAELEFQIGSGTPLNIAQSQSLASSTRVSLVNAEASVKTSRAMLQFLVGVPVEDRPLSDGYEPPADVGQSLSAWLDEADLHRQDLLAATEAVEAARQGVRAAVGEYFPSISFDPSYLIYTETPPIQQKWMFGLSVNIPIFSAGQTEADVRNALSILRAAVLSQSQARKQVQEDIETGWANLENSRRQVVELRVELKATVDALVLARRQFNVGLATNLDVLTAEDTLLSTQLQLATQIYQEKINYLNLLRVAGNLTIDSAITQPGATTEPANELEITPPSAYRSTTLPAR